MARLTDGFTYSASPMRVVFGSGTVKALATEAELLGVQRVLVLSTPQQAEMASAMADRLGALAVGCFTDATMHTPVHVTEAALEQLARNRADSVLAVGGGSTTGLGKALALRTDLPQIVIPTTYAGSEMTPILGETQDGRKTTVTSPKVLPEVVIYDVDLTMSLPAGLSGTSGINAIAHAVEALYARNRNPIIDLFACEAIGALADALPKIVADPQNVEARSAAFYGAWLAGICLGAVGMSLHHKLCHTLGGTFDLPHAETHAIVLPHALAYNAPSIPDVMTRLTGVLKTDNPAQALYDLAGKVGAKRGLEKIGMPADGIETACDVALSNPYWNPRAIERAPLQALLRRAHAGLPPFLE